jgi:REP element-mobilizing transposase RayT
MGHTCSSLFFHLVWSTKNRQPLIHTPLQNRLYAYIGGIIRKEKAELLSIGGTADHVHLLLKLETFHSLATLARKIKSGSSKFVNESNFSMRFAWQEGYGAFSVSSSKVLMVKEYISRQEQHHQKLSFQDEFINFLEKHGIVYPKEYLFT